MRFPVFDGHCDTAVELYRANQTPFRDWQGHVNLSAMEKLPHYAQFFAFCAAQYREQWDSEELFSQSLAHFRRQLKEHQETLTLCRNAAQLRDAWQHGSTAAFLSLEGAEGIGCDEGKLDDLAAAGFRMVSLTWNYANALGGSHLTGEGLTEQGRNFVRRAQKLGMLIDVSHLSDRGFYDLCDVTEAPIVASHSNSRTLCGHSRNLTDEMFRLIAQSGGTVGLNLYPVFLTGTEEATLSDFQRHLEHFLALDGECAVALGSDMDGIPVCPTDFSNAADYSALAELLSAHGVGDALMENLFAGNLLRVLENTERKTV